MKKRINIPLMFCFDTNYVIPAAAAFYSLMEHASKEYDYTFYILHSDITEYQQEKLRETVREFKNCTIEYVDMNHRLDDFWNKIYSGGHFSKEVMYKLFVASIFPDIDKIIVSDVDVIFLGDISQSYFDLTDNDDAYIAGVKPIGKISNYYFEGYKKDWTPEEMSKMGNVCGGYLVMNLKKIREDDFEKVFLKSLEENGYRLNQMEQDIFNITCYGKIKLLHLKYVACSYMWDYYLTDEDKETDSVYSKKEIEEAMTETVQLHYATSIKPWRNPDCTLSSIWFEYIMKTPLFEDYLKQLAQKIVIPDNRKQEIKDEILKDPTILSEMLEKYKVVRIAKKIKRSFKKASGIFSIIFDKNFIKKVKRKLFKKNYSYVIFDDTFPSDISAFRYEEFMNYDLDNDTYFAVTCSSVKFINSDEQLNNFIERYCVQNPHFYNRIINVSKDNRENGLEKIKQIKNPIAIFTFKNNILSDQVDNLSFLEENNIPFIFTLYPGGGLDFKSKKAEDDLKKIFNSKCFKKVIVTQDNVKDYLISNKLCKEENIEFIFGVVTPENDLVSHTNKEFDKKDKDYDVCFVAHKYSEIGEDKGYDLFIESAKELIKKNKNMKFYVVGEFNEKVLDVSSIRNNIEFRGVLSSEQLKEFYEKMDIIISPTRPYILSEGSFDGFPTGATTEAMLNEVVAITTDELKLNGGRFVDGEEIIIVKPDVKEIVKKVNYLVNNNDKLIEIARAGRKKVLQLYSYNAQIKPRLNIVNKIGKENYK